MQEIKKEEQERIELLVLEYCCKNGFDISKYSQYDNIEYKYYLTDYDFELINKELKNFQKFCQTMNIDNIVEEILDSKYIILDFNKTDLSLKHIIQLLPIITTNSYMSYKILGLLLTDKRIDWDNIIKMYLSQFIPEYYFKYIKIKTKIQIKTFITLKKEICINKNILKDIKDDFDLTKLVKLYNFDNTIKLEKYLKIDIKVK